jgi:DNA-binding PadR family transcriptional regulator
MLDYKKTHRCLLADVASGQCTHRGQLTQTLQALVLAGFLRSERVYSPERAIVFRLTLTPAGHEYLAGLWH